MKSDVTSFTRYFVLLIIVFLIWCFMLHNFTHNEIFAHFIGAETSQI